MENYPEKDKIAMLTGTAIQDDETFKLKGGLFQKEINIIFRCNKVIMFS